jgi:hypothetical protein
MIIFGVFGKQSRRQAPCKPQCSTSDLSASASSSGRVVCANEGRVTTRYKVSLVTGN